MAQAIKNRKNAIIFAGAGASKAVNSERYPTTVEFFERLPDPVRNSGLFRMAEQYLKKSDPERILDIEEVLWELQSLRAFSEQQTQEGNFVGYALRNGRLAHLLFGTNHNFNHLDVTLASVYGELENLIGSINATVYDFYDYEPSEDELSDNWLYLFSSMRKTDWDLIYLRQTMTWQSRQLSRLMKKFLMKGSSASRAVQGKSST